jgi:hypothetical protein
MAAYVQDPALAGHHGSQSLKIFEGFTPQRVAEHFQQVLRSWLALNGNRVVGDQVAARP